MRNCLACLLLAACLAPARGAAPPTPAPLADPALERRVAAVSHQLRCVVCQNQTIADSQAELAVDLRQQVREKLAQGMSEQAVIDHVVQRYGDFVLYRPALKATTILLWFGPALLLAGGIAAMVARLRAQRGAAAPAAPEELARAARLLDDEAVR